MKPASDVASFEAARADRLHALVNDALDLPPEERTGFLTAACGDDAALLAEAQSLVGYSQQTDGFLGRPAYAQATGEDLSDVEAGSLAAGTMLGEHRLLALLGEGGMGEVYLAEDTKLERRVAVKVLKHRLDDASLARRFRHERKVLATLVHPNISRLYGGGSTPEGRSYLVIEYVEGERLDCFCDTRALGVPARLALFRKVCAAVAYAHQNLVVHRDLKPANIRVTPEGEPKLLDFGIAKLLDAENGVGTAADPTVTLHAAMTPEYASPEQLRGEPITTSSDVYSLGVVLYELLCGQRPYTALKSRRPDELARAICEQDPPRPSAVVGNTAPTAGGTVLTIREAPAKLRRLLAGDLDNIVAKALRKEPARRYPSILALSEDLRRHSEGLPVTARPDTFAYRAGKFARRNKVVVAAAAFVLLALAGGLVGATWQARLARQERDRARSSQVKAETAQKQAEHLNSFLQNLLDSADPTQMGKEVKVVQMLDVAGKNVDRDLAGEPELLVQAHETLSRAYGRLEAIEPAEQHARAALDLARRLHGDESVTAAQADVVLGGVLNSSFRLAEAEPLLSRALAVQRRQPQPDRHAIAETLQSLGANLDLARRTQEAAPLLREALELMRETQGERSVDFVRVLYEIAHSKHMEAEAALLRGAPPDLDGAVAAYRRVMALCDEVSPHGMEALNAKFYLCNCLRRQHKMEESEAATKSLEAEVRQELGQENSFYAKVCVFGAIFDFDRGDNARVVEKLRQLLELIVRTYRPEHRNVVQVRGIYGLALTRTGHAAEGEPYLRAAYDHGQKIERFPFESTFGNVETALGECLYAQARYAEAEPLLLAGYEDLETRLGKHHTMTTAAAGRLHDFYLAWTKPAEAAHYLDNGTVPSTASR